MRNGWRQAGVFFALGAAVLFAQENVMRPAATGAAGTTRFVRIGAFDFASIVPAPPAVDSIAGRADLEAVRQVQAWRTPEQVTWAKLVEKDNVFNHTSELGAWFTAERLPKTAEFFKQVGDDMRAIDAAAKKPFLRARPSAIDPSVQPCVTLPTSTTYPSGSAMQALVWAELLAEIFPVKRESLIARAHRAAWGRVIGGVHFPSDLEAGRLLAPAYLEACRKNGAFQEAFAACKQELEAAAKEGGAR